MDGVLKVRCAHMEKYGVQAIVPCAAIRVL